MIKQELKKYASKERKKTNEWFFKTGKGQYGEGDIFVGVRTPDTRKVAKMFKDISLTELQKVISSKIHEERLCAILILVENSKLSSKEKDRKKQKLFLNFYLKNLKYVNNWDLVDLSAHYILGQAILDGIKSIKILDDLIESKILWERRAGIVATWIFIREGKIETTLKLSKKLLGDKEDLMRKAVGWMLREARKKDNKKVEEFLIMNYTKISRTALRYAIERIAESKRKRFLKGKFK
ncbi:MAG: DNA alkylation repair protein [Patescibacteria group bacterium]|nr:DNA alkylation repair protein [Patescibacteria group bacterium]